MQYIFLQMQSYCLNNFVFLHVVALLCFFFFFFLFFLSPVQKDVIPLQDGKTPAFLVLSRGREQQEEVNC